MIASCTILVVLCFLHDVNEGSFDFKRFNIRRKAVSPGAPPAPVRLPGQNFFEEKFSPFQWTGRWKFATNGGSSRHFYRRLNALKTARIESREDSKTLTVAEIGKNGVFFVKRARCNPRFSHFGCHSTLMGLEHPCITKSSRAFYKKKHHFSRFRRR